MTTTIPTAPPRPVPLPVIPERIPSEVQTERRWVVWKYEQEVDDQTGKLRLDPLTGEPKWTKVPYRAGNPTRKASSTNPKSWGTFRQALAAYQHGEAAGIGFVLGGGWAGIDLDHVIDPETGEMVTWALEDVRHFATYTERSPSGTGIRLLLRGNIVGRDGYNRPSAAVGVRVEAYSDRKFLTVTGHQLDGTLATVEARQEALEAFCARHFPPDASARQDRQSRQDMPRQPFTFDDEALIQKALAAKNGAKMAALMAGDMSGYGSLSEARMALLGEWVFWTDDAAQLDRLMRRSPLVDLVKWERLGASEIAKVLGRPHETYTPPRERPERDRHNGHRPPGMEQEQVEASASKKAGPTVAVGAKGSEAPEEPTALPWPAPLADAAYYGDLGTIAREMEPYIEADSAALLVNLILTAGVAMGHGPHLQVGAGQHTADYGATIGESGDNKADSYWPIGVLLEHVTAKVDAEAPGDRLPLRPQRTGGLSTGEGALQLVRDARSEWRRDKDHDEWVEEEVDPGVKDKRLLVVEGEFARLLAVMARQDNTLSMVLRQLHDGDHEVRSSPKVNAIVATDPHVGLIGMITPNELARKLHEVELFNGFANRFMWVLTHRIKSLPKPPAYTSAIVERHAELFSKAIARAHAIGLVTRDEEAEAIWEGVYEPLRRGDAKRTGMAREVCARAHTHVLRIALIFAALDGSAQITAAHLQAALAIWTYLEACAVYLFSRASGSPIADVIYDALVARGPLTRTDISHLFSRHVTAAQIQGALDTLLADGRVHKHKEETAGAPREIWEAVKK
jgi:hypothetical protein